MCGVIVEATESLRLPSNDSACAAGSIAGAAAVSVEVEVDAKRDWPIEAIRGDGDVRRRPGDAPILVPVTNNAGRSLELNRMCLAGRDIRKDAMV